ncbi:MAG: FkbM family methyltransferase, partial [Candidatus Promineifilaceae bacterium]
MNYFSGAAYYLRSIPTLLTGFDRPLHLFARLAAGRAAEARLRRQGYRFRVRSAFDVWIIKETCLDQDYLFGGRLEPGWAVLDIGAGLGDFTVLAAASCPRGVVHAYEPLAESYQLLRHNLALNGVRNVTAFPAAVSGRAGRLQPAGQRGPAVSTRFVAAAEGRGASAVTLAEALARLPAGRCDFLKLDCEGCEFELLTSCPP